jgi:TRAP-type C4-dicarboxylate transport system permease small subunit
MFNRLDRLLSWFEDLCGAFAAIGLGAIMLIVASDVGLRYILRRPWPWAYDVVSIYLTVLIFYLALSKTMREHGHINVDLLRSRMSVRFRHSCDFLICVLSIAFFALIAFLTARLTLSQFEGSDAISSYADWPTWLSTIFAPIGTVFIICRLALSALGHASVVWSGKEVAPITPLHAAEHVISTGE